MSQFISNFFEQTVLCTCTFSISAGNRPNQNNSAQKPNAAPGSNSAPKSDHGQSTPANPNTKNVGAKK